MKTKNKFIGAIAAAVCILPAYGDDPIGETRNILDQWVETKQILSEEKATGVWKSPSWKTPKCYFKENWIG